MKSTGSVVNYWLSNAIHGIRQSIKSLEAYVCRRCTYRSR